MAKAGIWAFGWIEVETETGRELCAMVVDEESELVETRVFPVAAQKTGITELIASAQAQVGRPKKITVMDGAMAKALRAAGVRVAITVERSPMLEEALRTLAETIITEGPAADFFAGDGVEPAHVKAFFTAAAWLWKAEPWWTFESGTAFSVRATELGVDEGGVFLMGGSDDDDDDSKKSAEGDEEPRTGGGWMLVFSQDDLAGLGQAMDSEQGDPGELANVLAMQFEHADEMGPQLDAFLTEHDLMIAGREAVPTLSRSVRGTGMVAPSAKDYELAMALCAALAELGEKAGAASDEEMLEVTVKTPSGAAVVVAGPMDEEDELEDEADEPMWSPPQHPWIEDVDAFVAERPEEIDETARRQLHLFCATSAAEGGTPDTWGEKDLRSFLAMVATTMPIVREEVGGLLDVVATWMDARAGLEGERSMRALAARERDPMIERVMDPEGWTAEKKVMIALREEGVDLMDTAATTAALERLFGKQNPD